MITIHWFDCWKTSSCAVSAGLSCSINVRWRVFFFSLFFGFSVPPTNVKAAVAALWPPLDKSLRFPSAASALSEAAAPSGHWFHWLGSRSVAEQGGGSDVEAVFLFFSLLSDAAEIMSSSFVFNVVCRGPERQRLLLLLSSSSGQAWRKFTWRMRGRGKQGRGGGSVIVLFLYIFSSSKWRNL